MLRVALFASVSSPQQATVDKDSLPSQLRDGAAWADGVGGQVVITLHVPGHSRKYIFFQDAERDVPAYRELREACERRDFDVLWCRARDRLGRTDALIAQVEALVANAGAEVYSAALPHQLGQATETSAIYLSAIERAAAQSENVTKSRRHAMGMSARARRGLHPNGWMYGYRPVRNDVGKVTGAEFAPEIEAIRLMTSLFLDGLGYGSIARQLDASPWRPARGDHWRRCTVHRILHNDGYAGFIHWRDATTSDPSPRFTPLWTPDELVAIRRERVRRHKGGHPPASILSGIVVCARCGWTMTAEHKRSILHYRCNRHLERRDCHANTTRADRLLAALAAYIQLLAQPGGIDVELERCVPDQTGLAADLERARGDVQRIRSRRDRLALLVSDGTMTADVYRSADDHLVEELEEAAARLAAAQTKLAAHPPLDEQRAQLTDLIATPGLLDDPANRLQLYRAGIRIIVEEREIVEIRLGG
jgi:DNA invertase Pin-like site-specific DNA recombinase